MCGSHHTFHIKPADTNVYLWPEDFVGQKIPTLSYKLDETLFARDPIKIIYDPYILVVSI